jgi:hypothetical protein
VIIPGQVPLQNKVLQLGRKRLTPAPIRPTMAISTMNLI